MERFLISWLRRWRRALNHVLTIPLYEWHKIPSAQLSNLGDWVSEGPRGGLFIFHLSTLRPNENKELFFPLLVFLLYLIWCWVSCFLWVRRIPTLTPLTAEPRPTSKIYELLLHLSFYYIHTARATSLLALETLAFYMLTVKALFVFIYQ